MYGDHNITNKYERLNPHLLSRCFAAGIMRQLDPLSIKFDYFRMMRSRPEHPNIKILISIIGRTQILKNKRDSLV